jgi:hypothetical protein
MCVVVERGVGFGKFGEYVGGELAGSEAVPFSQKGRQADRQTNQWIWKGAIDKDGWDS